MSRYVGRRLSELVEYASRREDGKGRKLCVPGMDTVRTCDCNRNQGWCHCSDSDCGWEPQPVWCDCPGETVYSQK